MRAIDFVAATAQFARQADARSPMRPMRGVVRMVAAGSDRPDVFAIARGLLDPARHDEPDLITLALAAFVRFTYRPWYRLAVIAEPPLADAFARLQLSECGPPDIFIAKPDAPPPKEAAVAFVKGRPTAVVLGALSVKVQPIAARIVARSLVRYGQAALFVASEPVIDEIAAARAEAHPDLASLKEPLLPSRGLWVYYGSNAA